MKHAATTQQTAAQKLVQLIADLREIENGLLAATIQQRQDMLGTVTGLLQREKAIARLCGKA